MTKSMPRPDAALKNFFSDNEVFADVFNSFFSAYSPEEQSRIRQGIMAFAVLRQGLSPADGRVFPEEVLAGNVAAVKKRLLPQIEQITGSVTW